MNLSSRGGNRQEEEKNTQVKWYTRKTSEQNDIAMPVWKYPQQDCLKDAWNIHKNSA